MPRRLDSKGRRVRHGGFTHQDPSMISLRDAWGAERIDIVVIPADAHNPNSPAAMLLANCSGPNERASRMLEMAGMTATP